MTAELWWTACTALLAASLWIPYIVGVNTEPATADPFHRPSDLSGLRPWVHRAHRAHLNLLEQAIPMAVLVLIAHATSVSTTGTVWATAAFFVLRLAHAVGMITGTARFPLRPIIFTLGWVCVLVVGGTVLVLG